MLKNKNIIFFANDWNSDNKTSSHQIASLLAKHNRVFFVEAGGMRSPSATGHDFRRAFNKILKFFNGAKQIKGEYPDLWTASLLILPFHKISLVRKLNQIISILTMRYLIKRYNFKSPIVFYFSPHVQHLCGQLKERLSIFYCIDNYSAYPGVDASEIRNMDAALSKKADLIFVVSQEIVASKKHYNQNVFYSPHGVDIENFSLQDKTFGKPALLKFADQRPIVMYWGLIADWMDFELVNSLVQNHPEMAFFFIGRICCDPKKLIPKENLLCPGPLPYNELGQYANFSSAMVIPFLINDWTKNINPIKLKEYLATGKPVISTAIPEALRNEDHVKIAYTKEQFSELLSQTVLNPDIDNIQKQLSFIRQYSWENRVNEISRTIAKHLL